MVPIYICLATASPPAVVNEPPLVLDDASVVLLIPIPPTSCNDPVAFVVDAVVPEIEI